MKIGVRTPSIKKSVKARTTGRVKRELKSSVNPLYGKKGMGWINDSKKAAYNKVYNKTTVGVRDLVEDNNTYNGSGVLGTIGNVFKGIGLFFQFLFYLLQLLVALGQVIFWGAILIFFIWLIIKIIF